MEKARGRDSKQENFRWDSRVSDEKRYGVAARSGSPMVVYGHRYSRGAGSKFMFLI